MTTFDARYAALLRAYVTSQDEQALASISEVGCELVAGEIPIEEIAGLQESAVLSLPAPGGTDHYADFVRRSSACLTELMIAYSNAYREKAELVARARERLQAEQHDRRLAALGQLVAGVAHELNNLLQPIRGMAELGLRDTDSQGAVHHFFATVFDCADQAAAVVRAILSYLREKPPQPHAIELGPALMRSIAFARLGLVPGLEINANIEEATDLRVIADENELTQVVVNLVQNACHALGKGEVLIRCRKKPGEISEPGCAACSQVVITVSDHGAGMSPDVADRAFDPFFTTKPSGQGTGLGLAIVREIVRSWGGEVSLETKLGHGTIVGLTLPLVVAR